MIKLSVLSLLGIVFLTHAVAQPKSVENLAYGQALSYFFEQRPLDAITTLQVALKRQQLEPQQTDAKILLAGLYFDYGLHQESAKLFTELTAQAQQVESSLQNKIWFNLAKVEFKQGAFAQAHEWLQRIQGELPSEQQIEKNYLLTEILIKQQRLKKAQIYFKQLPESSILASYARYNLALALLQKASAEQEKGVLLLQTMPRLTANEEESYSLADLAYYTLGRYFLQQQAYSKALQWFNKVGLESPLSNVAILGAGFVLSQLGQAQTALRYWSRLQQASQFDLASQESFLRSAMVLEQIQQEKRAVLHYQNAIEHYQQQLQTLEQLHKNIKQGALIDMLQQLGVLQAAVDLTRLNSDELMQLADYVYPLFSSDAFRTRLKNYRELYTIKTKLIDWKNKLPILQLMLKERQQLFVNKRQLLEESMDFSRLQSLIQQRDNYAEQMEQLKTQPYSLGLKTEQEGEQFDDIDYAQELLDNIQSQQDMSDEQQRLDRLRGILSWNIRTQYAQRRWQAKRQLKQLNMALEQAQQATDSLRQSVPDNEQRLYDFQQTIKLREQDNDLLLQRTEDLLQRQADTINELALQTLNQLKASIQALRLNAQYALARLQDKLQEAQ